MSITVTYRGRHQNISVETDDFLQTKHQMYAGTRWSFVDQLHPHHGLGSKVTWVLLYCCLFVKWRQQSPTFCKGLNISRMQAFVRLPTEFDNLLLNTAGYFDVSPKSFIMATYQFLKLFVEYVMGKRPYIKCLNEVSCFFYQFLRCPPYPVTRTEITIPNLMMLVKPS